MTGIVFKATGTNISADGYYQINANGDVVLTTEGAKAGVNDFEQGPNSGDYVVVVSDAAGNKLETTITLKETDLDENSPTVGNTTISYAENQTAGAVLGNIGAADDKGVTGIVFKATGTNISADGYYQINANGDVVLTTEGAKAGVNDFEQGPNSGDYVVVVSDAAGNKLETTITLKETDLDENSPTVGNTTISYAENQTAGAVLGNIGAADDKGVTGIVFKATGTNISADGYYQINANGDVVLTTEGAKAGVNDFEQGPNSGDYVVVVSDAAGNKLETTITLKETDLDENSPTVGNTTISYAENQTAGAVLGNIGAADDKGVIGIVFKATGTNISADGYYQINANGDVVLTTEGAKAGVNDFEQGPNSGDYVVVVSDAAGNKLETTITLKETDLDENSPTVGNTTISYAENQTAGAVLGNIGAADDKGVTGIVFKATGTNISADGYYQINANGDVVLTTEGAKAGVNDFEQGPNSGDYVVVVSDAAGNKLETTITLKETDVNEAPITSGGYAVGSEDTAIRLNWGQFNASDVDANSTLSIKITSLPADGVLQYNGVTVTQAQINAGFTISKAEIDSGKLQFKPDLHESSDAAGNGGGHYVGNKVEDYASFNYQVSDGSKLSATGNFVVDISAVADKPVLTLNNFQTVASLDFEDVNLGGREWRSDISINGVQGASTVGVWNTLNSGGKVEVGTEKTYTGGTSTNKVMEIEANHGDKTLYTDLDCEAGRFYQLGFDVAARLGNPETSDMTIKLVRLDASGNPISGTETLLYNFQPTDSSWLRNKIVSLPIDVSGKYRLIFEAVNADSTGAVLDNIKFQAVENKGYEDSFIKLSAINAALVDVDKSETLSVEISGLPEGSVLKDGIHAPITVGGTGTVVVTGWSLGSLQLKVDEPGNYNLLVKATATEVTSSGTVLDSAVSEAILPVQVLAANAAPVITATSVAVSEEGLLGGLIDTTDFRGQDTNLDSTNDTSVSGKLTISDANGDIIQSVKLVAPTERITSGDTDIKWTVSADGMTLTGKVGNDGPTAVTVTIDKQGNYNVNLFKPLDHVNADNVEGRLAINVGVEASDGKVTGTGTLTIQVEDDKPVVTDSSAVLKMTAQPTNLMLVLDVSTSMGERPSGGNGLTRFEMAQQALIKLLDRYQELGDVRVQAGDLL